MEGTLDRRRRAAGQLYRQAGWCRRLGSPLYGELLERAAADCEGGGPTWIVLEGHEDDSIASALALRLMGALHRLVLEGQLPELACHYPSAGGGAAAGDPWPLFRDALAKHGGLVRAALVRTPQTNEVGRSASLLGGFLLVARETGLPLRVLEIGSSAGLNLRWDVYRYEWEAGSWGDPKARVCFPNVFEGPAPDLRVVPEVCERAGCDVNPVDPTTEEGRLTLRSYLWPDQVERRARLDAALETSAVVPAPVERAHAEDWLRGMLRAPSAGTATIVFHSVVLQYLGREEARRLVDFIAEVGMQASTSAPLAWLRLEPEKDGEQWIYRVRVTTWPSGADRLLAASSPHGPPVRWLDRTPPARFDEIP